MQKLRTRIAALYPGRFRTYIAIVFVMAAVITIYSLIVVVQLRSDTKENNQRFNDYFNTAVDNSLNGISDFAYNILRSSYSSNLIQNDDITSAAGLRHEIYMYKNSNRLVGDIIEYFPVLNMVVGNNGYYSPLVYYKSGNDYGLNMAYSNEKFQQWFSCLFTDKQAGFYLIDDMNGKPAVFYFCSLPNPLNEAERREVVVVLSRDGLFAILKELVIGGDYKSAVLADDKGLVYASYGEPHGIVGETHFDIASVGKDFTILETDSPLLGLNCITITGKSTAYQTVTLVSHILIVADIVAILIGVILAFVYAERNRRELYRIASLFEPSQDENLSLEYIEKQIDTLLADNRSVVEEAEKQQHIVDSAFLREILTRKDATAEEINLITTLYNEDIANDTFILILIRIRSVEQIDINRIYQIVSRNEQENFRVYYTSFEDTLVFLINYDSDTENGRIAKLINDVINEKEYSAAITNTATSMPMVSLIDVIKEWESLGNLLSDEGVKEKETIEKQKSIKGVTEYVDPAVLANEIAVKEFNNSQLSLQLIAERVGVSQAYLSRVFKQKYGMSVMHYINYLRVEEAKRLFTSGDDDPLKVIALKVGFISDINLIRVFKKYENITPGLYRTKEDRPS